MKLKIRILPRCRSHHKRQAREAAEGRLPTGPRAAKFLAVCEQHILGCQAGQAASDALNVPFPLHSDRLPESKFPGQQTARHESQWLSLGVWPTVR